MTADPDRLSRAVGTVVSRLRHQAGMTLEELGARSGLHRTSVGLIERGERNLTVATAQRLAHTLGLTTAELIAEAEREAEDDLEDGESSLE